MSRRVALTFDFDAMSLWIGSLGARTIGEISRGEFGPIGLRRILELLERHEIEATFFVPGHTALAYPDSVRGIVAAGHEVGHHGFVHERISELTPSAQRVALERGFDALDSVASIRPVGFRSPSWDFSFETPRLLVEFGFEYDSSLMGSDFSLYWLRKGDEAPIDAPYNFGDETEIAEVPVSWLLDDFPHFEYLRAGAGPANLKSPSEVFEIWLAEFAYFVRVTGLDCFTLTMHPEVIGRGSRIMMLDRLLTTMHEHDGVRFTRLDAVVRDWKKREVRDVA